MTQTAPICLAPPPPPPPPAQDDNEYQPHAYPVDYRPPFISKSYVPFAAFGNCWPSTASPSANGMVSYPLCEGSPSSDLLRFNADAILNCEGLLPNGLPSTTLTPEDELPIPFTLDAQTLTSTDDSESTNPFDQLRPNIPPPPAPSQYPQNPPAVVNVTSHHPSSASDDTNGPAGPRTRRNSAPELTLATHDLERQLKHASRRASHNIVEKRYRINLNSKFRKLEEVVLQGTEPYSSSSSNGSSCSASNSNGAGNGNGKNAANGTSTGTSALSSRRQQSPKASIIESALGYIESLQSENSVLRGKLEFYEGTFGHGHAGAGAGVSTNGNGKDNGNGKANANGQQQSGHKDGHGKCEM